VKRSSEERSNLSALSRTPIDSLPVTLRRFCLRSEMHNVVDAAQQNCRKITELYEEKHPEGGGRVSVSRLCDLLGIHLKKPKALRRKSGWYSNLATSRRKERAAGFFSVSQNVVTITVPPDSSWNVARLTVAHEIGHWMLHRTDDGIDHVTLSLPGTEEEECVAEYCGRMLLMHRAFCGDMGNLAEACLREASRLVVTLHASASRLMDPDQIRAGVRGIVLWRLHPRMPATVSVGERLTPQWHICPGGFIPVFRCHARHDSLIVRIASAGDDAVADSATEQVEIGSLSGVFHVDAFSWGSIARGTRLVLSVFCDQVGVAKASSVEAGCAPEMP